MVMIVYDNLSPSEELLVSITRVRISRLKPRKNINYKTKIKISESK